MLGHFRASGFRMWGAHVCESSRDVGHGLGFEGFRVDGIRLEGLMLDV